MIGRPPRPPLFPYPPLSRSEHRRACELPIREVLRLERSLERLAALRLEILLLLAREELDLEAKGREALERALKRSEEHTSELQSPCNLVCRLLLENKSKR